MISQTKHKINIIGTFNIVYHKNTILFITENNNIYHSVIDCEVRCVFD